jgi:hypothetical protein
LIYDFFLPGSFNNATKAICCVCLSCTDNESSRISAKIENVSLIFMILMILSRFSLRLCMVRLMALVLWCIVCNMSVMAQIIQIPTEPVDQGDTALVFASPRPWMEKVEAVRPTHTGLGIDILLSGQTFGLGGTYFRRITDNVFATASFGFIMKQTADEIEYVDPFGNVVIPFKINRVFTVPLTLGVHYMPLGEEKLFNLLRPMLLGGVGMTTALIGPYSRDGNPPYFDFFESMSRATTIVRPTIFFGVGAEFASFGNSFVYATLRYYETPAGGDGVVYFRDLQSPDGFKRHTNIGGIIFMISFGTKY